MVKTINRNNDDDDDDDEKDEYFCFVGDCRERLGYPIPVGYFGNCLTLCFVAVRKKDLKGEYGFMNGVKSIQNAITEIKNNPLKDAEEWDAMFKKVFMSGNHFGDKDSGLEVGLIFKIEELKHLYSFIEQGLEAFKF
ncbi:unnamed protein product [Vicia faba]|uniref:Uncharacterized protein n=1 Tax=Vicia faba TaxID=3906 RepID=A0AAV0YHU0_VICFA|nr:unnamed protein product [Vicia faba]